MRGRDALARLRSALLGVVDGAGEAAAANLFQILYWVRSERQLMERIGFDLLLFRWFVCVVDPCRSPRAPQRTGTDF